MKRSRTRKLEKIIRRRTQNLHTPSVIHLINSWRKEWRGIFKKTKEKGFVHIISRKIWRKGNTWKTLEYMTRGLEAVVF